MAYPFTTVADMTVVTALSRKAQLSRIEWCVGGAACPASGVFDRTSSTSSLACLRSQLQGA
jgi:hypothetical protein